jgi:hypothetical protein
LKLSTNFPIKRNIEKPFRKKSPLFISQTVIPIKLGLK